MSYIIVLFLMPQGVKIPRVKKQRKIKTKVVIVRGQSSYQENSHKDQDSIKPLQNNRHLLEENGCLL